MPRHDFRCEKCAEVFEHQKAGSDEFVVCPICGSGLTHKVYLQAPATVMKWWDAKASSDSSGIGDRFRPRVDSKIHRRRRRIKEKV